MIQVRKQIEFRTGTSVKGLSDEGFSGGIFDTEKEAIDFVKSKFTSYSFNEDKSIFVKEEDGMCTIDNIKFAGTYRSVIYFAEINEEIATDDKGEAV